MKNETEATTTETTETAAVAEQGAPTAPKKASSKKGASKKADAPKAKKAAKPAAPKKEAKIAPKKEAKAVFYIVTPNPEQVMLAREDTVFAEVINSADISIPDGIGLVAANKFFRLPTTEKVLLKPFLYFAQGLGIGRACFSQLCWAIAR